MHCKWWLGAALLSLMPLASAETLLVKANGYSWERENLRRFDAMLISDQGKVLALGAQSELAPRWPAARVIDLGGKTVLPGLTDAHGHLLSLGYSMMSLNLRETRNLQEARDAIRAYVQQYPGSGWVLGGGWNQVVWQLGRFPEAADIDDLAPQRPVWLDRVDGHAGWANQAALRIAGIDKNTPDPAGGRIERDAAGNPTGVLIDSAMKLVSRHIPAADAAQNKEALKLALNTLVANGITSVHDAGINVAADQAIRSLQAEQGLPLRVYGMIRGTGEDFAQLSKDGPRYDTAQDRYVLRAVKLFSDGALGSRGAALLAPYSDAPHTKGLLFHTPAELQSMIRTAASRGYQVNVHAIGDAANREVLDAFAALPPQWRAARRHRIEHAQVVALEDMPRFVKLGLIPSMQPVHATSDMNMAEHRVGPQRIRGAYAWQRFTKLGARIACGSDFPIESPNPFEGMLAAVSRTDLQGQPQGGWYPDQAMSREQALRCFTLDAAFAAFQETRLGSLEKGKWADFVVIDRDILKVPVSEIAATQVLSTWVAGKQVYSRP